MVNVNIHRENCDLEIKDFPYQRFPGHEVCVSSVVIILDQSISDSYVTLTSSMVDRNCFNPEQELISFYNASYYGESKALVCQPTQLIWYKMQTDQLSDAVLNLQLEKKYKNVKIEKFYVQLRLRPICKA